MRDNFCFLKILFISIFSFSIFTLIFQIPISKADTIFSNVLPADNSFTFGKDTDIFQTQINDDAFNSTSAVLHIKVDEPNSVWYNVSLNCYDQTSQWLCNNTVPGFGSLASDGKIFIYYFEASNSSNSINQSSNYHVTIDRSNPIITFISPTNNSYIGGIYGITISVVDVYSGVNAATVQFSIDNSTWTTLSYYNQNYVYTFDLTSYQTNSDIVLYFKSADNVGNTVYNFINETVDNVKPVITINFPNGIQTATESTPFNAVISDDLSGIDFSSVEAIIYNSTTYVFSLNCSGSILSVNCNSNISVPDGFYTINFTATDIAHNQAINQTDSLIDDTAPFVYLISPQNGATVSGAVNLSIDVVDLGVGIDKTLFWYEGAKSSTVTPMNCFGNKTFDTCNILLNTADAPNGNYVLQFLSNDTLNHKNQTQFTLFFQTNIGQPSGNIYQTTTQTNATQTSQSTSSQGTLSSQFPQILYQNYILVIAAVIIIFVIFILLFLLWPIKTTSNPVAENPESQTINLGI